MKDHYASPASSPATPPSPLPVSVGPGSQNYIFSSSPSPSPPFSPPPSSHTSAENLPLLLLHDKSTPHRALSAFSLDRSNPDESDSKSSCLEELLRWLVSRCFCCCSSSLFENSIQNPPVESRPRIISDTAKDKSTPKLSLRLETI